MAEAAAARPGAAAPVATDGAPGPGHWEHFDHGADIGVRGWGATKAEAFEQAALALTAVVTDPARVLARETVPIYCEAGDDELLLAAWLNAIVSTMAVRRMLFAVFHVEFDGDELNATATGERVSVERHQPAVEVKGATYTLLRVGRTHAGGWLAQTVVDV
ncbi:MAG TPA: archease [Ramlibacter sp.]|nr:archease [Ramlibacter sp.]